MDTYFFDLDGTLTDSAPGLLTCFRTALESLGVMDVEEASLRRHLGEPLPVIFRANRPEVTEDEMEEGIKAFRTRFDAEEIYVNELYDGVTDMLEALRGKGISCWIVTSKPTHHAEKVCDILNIRPYFAGVVGAGLAETDTKTSLLREGLTRAGARADSALFVGDRKYDIIGALENGVLPVGALWGYGSRDELLEAGCREFAESPMDFLARLAATPAAETALGLAGSAS